MDFDKLAAISDEQEQLKALYDIFDEASRLTGQAQQIEFITSCRAIEAALPEGASILELGAGTGRYSHYLAARGHQVQAVEPVPKHAQSIQAGIKPGMALTVQTADALTALGDIPDKRFDAVLCMGPLYHMHDEAQRLACLRECARVCKEEGLIWAAFINADFVIATQTLLYDGGPYLDSDQYDHDSFRLPDFPFKFDRLDQAEGLIKRAGLQILRRIASDGLSELHAPNINAFTPAQYAQWLKYHLYTSEQPAFLGMSNHWLFALRAQP